MKLLVILTLLASLSYFVGCGLFGSTKEEVVLPPPPVISQAPIKPVKREPGSLWGEDSRWNEIYTFTPARRVGDIVQVKVTDTLKFRIEQSLRAKMPATSLAPDKVAQGPSKAGDPQASLEAKPEFNGGEAKAAPGKQSMKNDTAEVEGTILEIPSKGVYRVYVNKPMALGLSNPYVVVDGIIRERDIKADDSVSSEAIFNMKVDAVNLKPGTVIKDANGQTVSAPEGK